MIFEESLCGILIFLRFLTLSILEPWFFVVFLISLFLPYRLWLQRISANLLRHTRFLFRIDCSWLFSFVLWLASANESWRWLSAASQLLWKIDRLVISVHGYVLRILFLCKLSFSCNVAIPVAAFKAWRDIVIHACVRLWCVMALWNLDLRSHTELRKLVMKAYCQVQLFL